MIDDGGAFLATGHDLPEMSPPNSHQGKTAAFLLFPLFSLFIAMLLHPSRFIPRLSTSPVPRFVFCCAEVCIHVFLIPVHLLSGSPFPSPILSEAFQILETTSRAVPTASPSRCNLIYVSWCAVSIICSCVDECHAWCQTVSGCQQYQLYKLAERACVVGDPIRVQRTSRWRGRGRHYLV